MGSAGRRSEVHPRGLSPRRDWQGAEWSGEYTGEGRGGGHIHPSHAYIDRPSKKFNHDTDPKLNKHILNSSDTGELSRCRDGPDRLRGKDGDEDRGREGRDGVNGRHTNSGLQCSTGRDNDRNRGRERGSERDRGTP
jgi:hypothetical protein